MKVGSQLRFIFGFVLVALWTCDALLEPGIIRELVVVDNNGNYVGFPHSAYADTQLELRIHCDENDTFDFEVQVVVRSSPCDREFFVVASRYEEEKEYLAMYFSNDHFRPDIYDYTSVVYSKSEVQTLSCGKTTTNMFPPMKPMRDIRLPNKTKGDGLAKRQVKTTNLTQNSFVVLPVDAIYLAIIKMNLVSGSPKSSENVTIELHWKGKHGYVSAIDWPLVPFYAVMCGVYTIYALAWLFISVCQWKDLLRIQYWIGAVIILGMLEKAMFYSEYANMNWYGESVQGAIELAELVSCLKRTLSRMLVIIVSVGFGVVKPRLGSTLHKVVGVGFIYFILCAIEGVMRVSKASTEAAKQKQMAGLPLTLLEVAIFWWIFSALVNTMRSLRLRRNEVKLSLYRHFTNTLIFAILISVAFMTWSLLMHVFTVCLTDWSELWVDTAFWHMLFSVILLVIMVLWRPTNNNQRYAFTPLLDGMNDSDDDEEDELYNADAYDTAEQMKLRGMGPTTKAENRKSRDKENSLEDELRWVEENIPSSMTDKALPALIDSDEELQQTKFEISKMQ